MQNKNPVQHHHSPQCGCKNEKGEPIFISAPSESVMQATEYCEKNMDKFLQELKTLVNIPSVSLSSFDAKVVNHSAQAVAELFHSSGLNNVEVITFDDVHPYVYADWLHKPDAPTLLLYAHHDVQPPGRLEHWKSDPFIPKESNGRLYGRGTADDKAGILAHVAAIDAYLKTMGELPVNVKLLIEGEEEIGSEHLDSFVRLHRDKLKADGMILTDCANVDTGIPTITTALRGLVAVDIDVTSSDHPVHSGLWGGILPDPVVALSRILSTLVDVHGNILIPGILDDVRPLSSYEQKTFEALKLQHIARSATGLFADIPFVVSEKDMAKHLWRLPHLSVNAIQSGSRSLVSNIIQDGAWGRVSIRIVADMNPQKVLKQLTDFIKDQCPVGFHIKVTPQSASQWWAIDDVQKDIYQIAARSLEKGYGRSTQFAGCGASIPFVQPLSQELGGIPAILVGVEDPYTNAHSENESLNLSDFKKAILGQIYMLSDLAKYKRL